MFALRRVLTGQRFTIYALEEGGTPEKGGTCELNYFINTLGENDAAGLMGRVQRDADHGPPKNEEQSKDVGGGIFELKYKAFRILWFYEAGKMIICSHGFSKGAKKIQNREIGRAQERLKVYEKQKALGKPIEKRDDQ